MTSMVDRANAPGPGPLRPFRFPAIERFELGNGMPVLFAATEGLPVVTFSLLLPGGALREPEGSAGVATLTGSTLESGTRSMGAAGVARRLEAEGIRLHVGTSWEVSHLDFTCLNGRAGGAADIATELVSAPSFPPEEVDRIRGEMLAGIMQRRADPRSLANEMASRFVFAESSPFSRPVGGTALTVGELRRESVLAFHRAAFTPRSGGLIVAGNMTAASVREVAEASFGTLSGPPPPPALGLATPRTESVQVIVVERPGAVQAEIRIGHLGVTRLTPDYFPILVMNTILGGAFTSRLNLNLRERHGFTYGVSSTFVMRRTPGPFLVSTAVQTAVTGQAVGEILSELRRIREEPVTEAEIQDARQYLAGTYPLRLQTTDGIAARLSDLFVYDLPDSYLEEFAARVLAVTADQVRHAAHSHIRPDELMVLVVGPSEEVVPQLEGLGLGEAMVVRPEEVA